MDDNLAPGSSLRHLLAKNVIILLFMASNLLFNTEKIGATIPSLASTEVCKQRAVVRFRQKMDET